MALETLTRLATYTVPAGGVASYTFANIPQTYTDLKIVYTAITNRTGSNYTDDVYMEFNGVTTGLTSRVAYGGNGAASGSLNNTTTAWAGYAVSQSGTASTYGNSEIYILNYTSNNVKSMNVEGVAASNSTTGVYVGVGTSLWNNTSPIRSVLIRPGVGTAFNVGSTFTLYGIKNERLTAGSSLKATGGAIQFDGTYVYHTFTSTGAFTPNQPLTADILVVAGGGAGGAQNAGGGGAGGLLQFNSQSLTPQTYTCTIGAGGTSVYQGATTNGVNSNFGSLTTAVGGGAGGFFWGGGAANAQSGGSGGGAHGVSGAIQPFGAGTPGQGNNGGSGGTSYAGAGGGGAGAAGSASPASEVGGAGGIGATSGLINSIGLNTGAGQLSGTTYYFAGGGGGGGDTTNGAGGLGGGGAAASTSPTRGTANTGGGGGAARGGAAGGAGGSGIIVVRYKG